MYSGDRVVQVVQGETSRASTEGFVTRTNHVNLLYQVVDTTLSLARLLPTLSTYVVLLVNLTSQMCESAW